jgi:hypothetical protein
MSKNTLDLPRYILYDDQECTILCASESLKIIATAIMEQEKAVAEEEVSALLLLKDKLDHLDDLIDRIKSIDDRLFDEGVR